MGRTTGSGQGSVYKRGAKWRGQITINGERLSYTADKKSEVNSWLAKVKTDASLGLLPKNSNLTVEEFGRVWLERKIKPTVSPQTFKRYTQTFNRHFFPKFGNVKLQALTPDVIEVGVDELFSDDYSDEYVKNTFRMFKRMLTYAVNQEILIRNPCDRVTLRQRTKTSKVSAYTEEEQKKLVNYLKEHINKGNTVLYLLLTTGMRLGEALALNVSDLNLSKKYVTVSKTVVLMTGGNYVQDSPKTSSSNREIYLSDNTTKYLRSYIRKFRPTERLFPNICHFTVRKKLIKICAELGITYRNVHSLRHTWATRALEKGIDVKTVSHLLGHRSVLTTMNIYQDVYSGQKIKAANLMNDLF